MAHFYLEKQLMQNTGDIYGRWIVLDENDFEQKKGYKKVLCECQCVNKTKRYIDERNLKNGTSISCGKCGYKLIECGDKFGEWTTLEPENKSDKILCKCSCGTEKKVNKFNLNHEAEIILNECECNSSLDDVNITSNDDKNISLENIKDKLIVDVFLPIITLLKINFLILVKKFLQEINIINGLYQSK